MRDDLDGQRAGLTDARDVEVTLTMDAATYRRIESRLDALIMDYDLDNRIRRMG